MLVQAFAPMFAAELAAKDFRYVLAAGQDDAATPVMRAASAVFHQAMARGFAADNLTAVCRLYD